MKKRLFPFLMPVLRSRATAEDGGGDKGQGKELQKESEEEV